MENAIWAAVQGYEAVDYIIHTIHEISFNGPEAEMAILINPLVQNEIERQIKDVVELEKCSDNESVLMELGKKFHRKAASEGSALVHAMKRLQMPKSI